MPDVPQNKQLHWIDATLFLANEKEPSYQCRNCMEHLFRDEGVVVFRHILVLDPSSIITETRTFSQVRLYRYGHASTSIFTFETFLPLRRLDQQGPAC